MTLLHKIQNQTKITHGVEVKMVVTFEEEGSVIGWVGMRGASGMLTMVCFYTNVDFIIIN